MTEDLEPPSFQFDRREREREEDRPPPPEERMEEEPIEREVVVRRVDDERDEGRGRGFNQRLLEAIFGDQAVRTLATRAREDLLERVFSAEADRFERPLERLSSPPDAQERLAAALDGVRRAR